MDLIILFAGSYVRSLLNKSNSNSSMVQSSRRDDDEWLLPMFGYGDEAVFFIEEGSKQLFIIDKVEYSTIIHSLVKKAYMLRRLNLKMPGAGRGVMKTDMVPSGLEFEFEVY
nr:hypothetical protein [Tanacetum cinerariifolium]